MAMDGGVVVIRFDADTKNIDSALKNINDTTKQINAQAKLTNAQARQYDAETRRIKVNQKDNADLTKRIRADAQKISAQARLTNAETNRLKANLKSNLSYLKESNTQYKKISVSAGGIKAAMASSLKSLVAMVSIGALGKLVKGMMELSSDLTEVQNVVETAFPRMTAEIDAWSADSIKKFGLSEKKAKEYASTLGLMTQSMGLTEEQSYKLGTNLAQLTGDLASMYNKDQDDVFTNVKAGILQGRANSMASLGIVLSDANIQAWLLSKGIQEDYSQMDAAAKVATRYNYIMEQTTKIQGDFTKTSGTWANQSRILKQNLDALGASLGDMLVTAILPLVKALNVLIERLIAATNAFKEFMATTFGIKWQKAAASGGITGELDDIETGAESAGKALEKLTKGPFSELHTLSKDSGSGSGGAGSILDLGGYDVETPDTSAMTSKIEDFANRIKESFQDLGKKIGLDILFGESYQAFQDTVKQITDTIGELQKAFDEVDFTSFRNNMQNIVVTRLTVVVTWLRLAVRWYRDLIKLFTEPIKDNAGGIAHIFQEINDTIEPAISGITEFKNGACQDLIKLYDEHFHPMMDSITEFLSVMVGQLIDMYDMYIQPMLEDLVDWIIKFKDEYLKPFWDDLTGMFAELFDDLEMLMPILEPIMGFIIAIGGIAFRIIYHTIIPLVERLAEFLINRISGFVKIVKGALELIGGILTGDLSKIMQGVYDIISGALHGVLSVVEYVVNRIIDGINLVRSALMMDDIKHINIVGTVDNWLGDAMGVNKVSESASNAAPHSYTSHTSTSSQSTSTTAAPIQNPATSGFGNITIPVYVGNEKLDDYIVKATEINNYRNGR